MNLIQITKPIVMLFGLILFVASCDSLNVEKEVGTDFQVNAEFSVMNDAFSPVDNDNKVYAERIVVSVDNTSFIPDQINEIKTTVQTALNTLIAKTATSPYGTVNFMNSAISKLMGPPTNYDAQTAAGTVATFDNDSDDILSSTEITYFAAFMKAKSLMLDDATAVAVASAAISSGEGGADTNDDGKVSEAEFTHWSVYNTAIGAGADAATATAAADAALLAIDSNSDGEISTQEEVLLMSLQGAFGSTTISFQNVTAGNATIEDGITDPTTNSYFNVALPVPAPDSVNAIGVCTVPGMVTYTFYNLTGQDTASGNFQKICSGAAGEWAASN